MTQTYSVQTALAGLLIFAAGPALAAASPQDFIKNAIQGDNSEIMLGTLAQHKGSTEAVRDFGTTLVNDHSTARQQAEDVAKTLNVTPPDQPSSEADTEQTNLSKLSGTAFDDAFAATW